MSKRSEFFPLQVNVMLGNALAGAVPRWVSSTGGQPLVTYVDDATGDRTELSLAAVANWATKTANLLQFEIPETVAGRGSVVLRTQGHWLAVPVAVAAWRLGMSVIVPGDRALSATAATAAIGQGAVTVAYEDAATPADFAVGPLLGGRLSPGAPPARAFVEEVLGEADDVDADDPSPDDLAMLVRSSAGTPASGHLDFDDLTQQLPALGRRWLLLDPIDSAPGLVTLAAAILRNGSLVILRNGREETLPTLVDTEKVDAVAATASFLHHFAALAPGTATVTLPTW